MISIIWSHMPTTYINVGEEIYDDGKYILFKFMLLKYI